MTNKAKPMRHFLLLSIASAVGCTTPPPPAEATGTTAGSGETGDTEGADTTAGPNEEPVTLCAAVRGNGAKLTAHYASLARIVETHGLLDGIAGGSSGSITSFLVDSMHQHPAVFECGDVACDPAEQRARMALLLKSFVGYLQALSVSGEGEAFSVLAEIISRIEELGVEGLLKTDPQAGVQALLAVLQSEDLRALVNPELVSLLQNSPDPVWHARDVVSGLAGGLSFQVSDTVVFTRPGPVNFVALADALGSAGTFYAGWAPTDAPAMEAWLSACAAPTVGMTWAQAGEVAMEDSTCGARFVELVTGFRTAWAEGDFVSRVDDMVGSHLHALVSTSVLTGEAIDQFEAATSTYLAAQTPQMEVSFDDVSFGYWGRTEDLAQLEANPLGFSDAQTNRRLSLGPATWREVLELSPAEPGLSRALEIDDDHVSAGGWSDLFPVRALQNIGCDEVIYVTRRAPTDEGFAMDVATLLGMDPATRDALYDFDDPQSAVGVAVLDAGAVWCTDWDGPELADVEGTFLDSYTAPMEVHSAFFTDTYDNGSPDLGIRGCTPPSAR